MCKCERCEIHLTSSTISPIFNADWTSSSFTFPSSLSYWADSNSFIIWKLILSITFSMHSTVSLMLAWKQPKKTWMRPGYKRKSSSDDVTGLASLEMISDASTYSWIWCQKELRLQYAEDGFDQLPGNHVTQTTYAFSVWVELHEEHGHQGVSYAV